MAKLNRAFIKYDSSGKIIPSTLILRSSKPSGKGWVEIESNICCPTSTSTSTSTTTTTSTSTTTTTTLP